MCILISLLMAVLYVGAAIIIKKKLPDSISSMVYILPEGGWRWLWTVWIWLTGLLLIAPLMNAMPENWKFIAFLTIGCLMFCGAMPIFIEDNHKWHNILGIAAGILSQVCVAFISPWWLSVWLLWPFLMGSTIIQPDGGDMREMFSGKGIFVAEAICFITLCGCLI